MHNLSRERALKRIHLALLLGMVALSWAFSRTDGLVYGTDRDGQTLHTSELQSSGSNDNLAIETGMVLFAVPLIFMLLMKPKWSPLVTAVCWAAQGLLVLSLDAGSIPKTVFDDRNLVLSAWLASFLALPLVLIWEYTANRPAAESTPADIPTQA